MIARNTGRKPKNLWTDAGDGERIVGYVADNEHDEAPFVAEEIDRLGDDDGRRGPATSRSSTAPTPSPGCSRRCSSGSACPTRSSAGCGSTSAREVRDALAYLRVLANPDDTVSLRRILNMPKRGIGDRAEACVEALAERERISFGEALRRADEAPGHRHPLARPAIQGFVALLEELRSRWSTPASGPATVLEAVLERTGYLAELRGQPTTRRTRPGSRTSPSWSPSPASSTRRGARPARCVSLERLPRAGLARRRRRPDPRRRGRPTQRRASSR